MSINSLTEKIIIKGCLIDKNYVSTLSSTFEKEFFDDNSALRIYEYINNYYVEYKEIPSKDLIIGELDKNGSNEIRNFLTEVESFDYDWIKNYDHAFNITNEYLKGQSIKKAILNAVDIINKKGNIIEIRKHVEDALCKDLKIDLGTNYFGSIVDRIERMTSDDTIRVPTGYPTLDEYISGGFPPNSLSVIISKIHGGKSAFLANIAARQVLLGKNVVLVSLEMSEDAFSQRFDSIYSLLDINRMYRDAQLKTKLLKSLYNVAKKTNRGNLYIKQFPTGNATVNDYRKYFRELIIRGIKPDVFICDYINLMRPEYRNTGEMYMDVKTISEELRAFSFAFKIPVVSVSQLNREGMKVPFQEIDFTYIAECLDLNTKVYKWDGKIYKKIAIKLLEVNDLIMGSNGNVTVTKVYDKKIKKMYKIKTKSGREIICSADHEFPTSEGLMNIKNGLKVGKKINSL
jgi:replicative DNA helicase